MKHLLLIIFLSLSSIISYGQTNGDPTLLDCAVFLSQNGWDVVPQNEVWDEFIWEDSECGTEPIYYIVEVRFAVLANSARLRMPDRVGGYSFSVASVDAENNQGEYSIPVMVDTLLVFDGVEDRFAGIPVVCDTVPPIDPPVDLQPTLIVEYTFDGVGNTIYDVSEYGFPLDLTIDTPSEANLMDGALVIHGSSKIDSGVPATKLINACKLTNEISVVMNVNPDFQDQTGPARILSLSLDSLNRDFTIGQDNVNADIRLRTTATDNNGTPSVSATAFQPVDFVSIVYTHSDDGVTRIYVNGVIVEETNVGGDFSNWEDYILMLGNEQTGDRPWLGNILDLKIYDGALTEEEVSSILSQ
jgi:hypothetical protein